MLIPTDGGRYDVDLHRRQRRAIYWEEPVSDVRRCSWFYKGEGERWYLPYDETQANRLEVCSLSFINLKIVSAKSYSNCFFFYCRMSTLVLCHRECGTGVWRWEVVRRS